MPRSKYNFSPKTPDTPTVYRQKELCYGIIPIAVFDGEVKALIIKQISADKDFWGFPKGHKENDKSDIKAASRELKEETGLTISHLVHPSPFECNYSFVKKKLLIQKKVFYFLAHIDQPNNLILNKECSDFKWLPINFVKDCLSYETLKTTWNQVLQILIKLPNY